MCKKQLKIFLDDYDQIPFKVLNYLGSDINYGGRVTDSIDIRLIQSILSRFIQPETLDDEFKFSDSGIYKTIPGGSQDDYVKYV